MGILYLSDLDGTLFNDYERITDYTAQTLNKVIEKGNYFTVATARMPYECDYLLERININTPGILTNGVFLYDFSKKTYVSSETIENEKALNIIKAFHMYNKSCFLYIFDGVDLSLYYDSRKLEGQYQYLSYRALTECKEVAFVNNLEDVLKTNKDKSVYFAITDKKTELDPIVSELKKIDGIDFAYYLNIYNNLFCLEVFSKAASKMNALKKLITIVSPSEVVVFGDNYNDLTMISIADRSYAPVNAVEEVKQKTTSVIGDNNHDGVAEFLAREWMLFPKSGKNID